MRVEYNVVDEFDGELEGEFGIDEGVDKLGEIEIATVYVR